MLRALCKFFQKNECQFARFNSTLGNQRQGTKEFRDVKLIGTVYQNILTRQDGSKSILIRTVNQIDSHYQVHKAIVSAPTILNLIGDNLKVGQRIYINGELQTYQYTNEQDFNHNELEVRVRQLYATKLAEFNTTDAANDETKTSLDENNVTLLAHIISEISHFENSSAFTLGTNYPTKSGDNKLLMFRVYVHEPSLVELVKNSLQRRDRVFVNGFLNYKSEMDKSGVKKRNGYIEAKNIFKVDRFNTERFNEAPNEEAVAARE